MFGLVQLQVNLTLSPPRLFYRILQEVDLLDANTYIKSTFAEGTFIDYGNGICMGKDRALAEIE